LCRYNLAVLLNKYILPHWFQRGRVMAGVVTFHVTVQSKQQFTPASQY
jgi:hypothetical protein